MAKTTTTKTNARYQVSEVTARYLDALKGLNNLYTQICAANNAKCQAAGVELNLTEEESINSAYLQHFNAIEALLHDEIKTQINDGLSLEEDTEAQITII